MHPYYTITNESKYDENAGFHYFRFSWSHDTYVAVEYFCTNPRCECNSVTLDIDRVTPSGTTEKIGCISLRIPDFEVEEVKAKHKAVYQSKMNKEFKQGIPEEWKPYILEHSNHMKEYKRVRLPAKSLQEGTESPLTASALPSLSYDPMSKPSIELDKASTIQQSVKVRSASLPGRNDPCSCGSGKKYKKCCGSAGG
jgi:hypothetical protein